MDLSLASDEAREARLVESRVLIEVAWSSRIFLCPSMETNPALDLASRSSRWTELNLNLFFST